MPVTIDQIDSIDQLLDVLHATKDLPNLSAINQGVMTELVRINTLVAEEQAVEAEAQRKKADEEAAAARAKAKREEEEAAKKEKSYA